MSQVPFPHLSSEKLLMLAPMEGVVDWVTRELFSKMGAVDLLVTEFIRVTDRVLPDEVYYRYCPELHTAGRTRTGNPVIVQLLGGDAQVLADNAARACELGAPGIDLNFGCPAKTVNRHDGGAVLLKQPDRIFKLVEAVRKAVPNHIPVSAKIRLGFDDPNLCLENAQSVESAGAQWITIHCRTKMDMYKPPAYWDWIPKVREKVPNLPIVANGEIWTLEDYINCKNTSQSEHIMIGRGALADPFLFVKICQHLNKQNLNPEIQSLREIILNFYDAAESFRNTNYAVSRTKQWLRQLALKDNALLNVFNHIKTMHEPVEFKSNLYEKFPQ